jgi:predicted nucleotidyltransferase
MTEAQFGLSANVISQLRSVLAQHPNIECSVVYGSRAKGNYKPGSDIDLTLFPIEGKDISFRELCNILDEIDDLLLPYIVDLSVFSQIDNSELRAHIERVGKVFYAQADVNFPPASASGKTLRRNP